MMLLRAGQAFGAREEEGLGEEVKVGNAAQSQREGGGGG